MTDLHLDRLTLRLAGISEADGRRLAQLLCSRLADATPPNAAGGAEALTLTLAARPSESLDGLAQRIVAELLSSLARSVT